MDQPGAVNGCAGLASTYTSASEQLHADSGNCIQATSFCRAVSRPEGDSITGFFRVVCGGWDLSLFRLRLSLSLSLCHSVYSYLTIFFLKERRFGGFVEANRFCYVDSWIN